jgi:hypothetical protein
MKKIALLSSALVIACNLLNAQESNVAAGGDDSNFSGSISYSIGVVFYTAEETDEGTLTQGVQHVQQEVITKVETVVSPSLELNVFPNPVVTTAQFNLNLSDFTNVNYRLVDMQGKVLQSEAVYAAQTTFSLEEYPSGIYFLLVQVPGYELQKFELVKI